MPPLSIEQHWIDTSHGQLFAQSWRPYVEHGAPIVLLHDSLGCVALWREFPEQLATACGRQVIAYDRLGFGRSAPFPGTLPANFVENEAQAGFQALREQLDFNAFVVFGHSVGGGMAVGCAAAYPQACQHVISESAQAFVEDRTLAGIRDAERQFAEPGQMARLQKYHGEKAHWVLRAWVDNWLSDAFSQWRLDAQLSRVRCPTLAVHGDRDEFGSALHPQRIAALTAGPASLRILPDCGHVPHREYPDAVLAAVSAFLDPAKA
ncbi:MULTISPECIES: alpha/beta fold hydrolase [Pseudomonas]|uniref:Alpha/beta hydrolase n=2 Tax=unclassified Pseudomonas TaxID=196821 RepID=A0AB39I221_9PSED|nr:MULTISPECIES: alpha/beta hydrolase [unclassified Pseudomonas]KJK07304.1 alpha/beta hydrolase [Pseudomonas sp. 5]QYX48659.1 alpha/beta hydrolase [Pseudomonas sp. S11A 273]